MTVLGSEGEIQKARRQFFPNTADFREAQTGPEAAVLQAFQGFQGVGTRSAATGVGVIDALLQLEMFCGLVCLGQGTEPCRQPLIHLFRGRQALLAEAVPAPGQHGVPAVWENAVLIGGQEAERACLPCQVKAFPAALE